MRRKMQLVLYFTISRVFVNLQQNDGKNVVYGLMKRFWKNKHTRQYNSEFKNRSYSSYGNFDKCCKGIF